MEAIPAIDLLEGKCVRLKQGNYQAQTVYNKDPLAMAKYFESKGFRALHLVDLDGARNVSSTHLKILEKMAQETQLKIDFGGGMRSKEKMQQAFDYGANQITAGSMAIQDTEGLKDCLESFGAERIIIGADAKDGLIKVNGWQEGTAIKLVDFMADFISYGAKHFICTDIRRDGMMTGPATKLYEALITQFPSIALVASGGVSKPSDLLALESIGIEKAIVGKALYESEYKMEEWLL